MKISVALSCKFNAQIKWEGYDINQCTWEPAWSVPAHLVAEFEASRQQHDPSASAGHDEATAEHMEHEPLESPQTHTGDSSIKWLWRGTSD